MATSSERKIDLTYLFKDLNNVGLPSRRPLDVSLISDDQVYQWDPDRFRFYQELIQELAKPNSKVIDSVIGIENRTRRTRELINENIDTVANTLEYLYKKKKAPADGSTPAPPPAASSAPASSSAPAANPADGSARSTDTNTDNKDMTRSINIGLDRAHVGYQLRGGNIESYDKLAKEINKKESTDKEKKSLYRSYLNDPVLSPKHEAVTAMDRTIFIAITFVLRAVSLFIVEWALNTRMVEDFQGAFGWYIGVYLSIFILWTLLVNVSDSNLFFKMLFYYIYAGNPDKRQFMIRIGLHVIIQIMLLPVLFIVKEDTVMHESNLVEMEDGGMVYAKRRKIYKTISYFTFATWLITSIIATRV